MAGRRRVLGLTGVIAVLVVAAFVWWPRPSAPPALDLTTFQRRLDAGDVAQVTLLDGDHQLRGRLTDGSEFRVGFPSRSTADVTKAITRAGVTHFSVDQQHQNRGLGIALGVLPFVFIGGIVLLILRQTQGGRGLLGVGRGGKPVRGSTVTFADVAGLAEPVEELTEIRDFLTDPTRFEQMGARIPKGVLLYGPPGTGKTLLARGRR